MLTIKFKRNTSDSRKYLGLAILVIPLTIIQTSCKKMVEVSAPINNISEENVYSTNSTAIAVLSGLYNTMNLPTTEPFQGNKSISLLSGLSSDELTLYSGITDDVYIGYYENTLSATIAPIVGSEFWSPLYNYVFRCNAAIEGLNASSTLTSIVKQQLLGEAKFMRAFYYFYLVNLFGDVPLALTTDPQINTLLARSPKAQVYLQIINDLKEAKELLSADYLNQTLLGTTTERVRPSKWAAAALLARVYLFTGDFVNAEAEATMVVNNSSLYSLPPLNNAFLKNSQEAIWQIQPTGLNFNTEDARTYIIPATGPSVGTNVSNPVYLSNNLLNIFEPGDQRTMYGNWIDTTIYQVNSTDYDTVAYPYKYKINEPNPDITQISGTTFMTEYFMVLRLAEQYLIRAEARTQQSNIGGAQSDLNAIRIRAGLSNTAAGDKTSLLTAILHERQVELFTEWGHRWLDLKRTGQLDAIMSIVTPLKTNGAPWQSFQQLYPLPLTDLNTAPNIVQNPGY